MIPVGRDKILSRFTGIRAVLKIIYKLYLTITGRKFHPEKRDSFFVMPESRFVGKKFSHVIASALLSGTKKLISTSV